MTTKSISSTVSRKRTQLE